MRPRAHGAPTRSLTGMRYFRAEFDDHIVRGLPRRRLPADRGVAARRTDAATIADPEPLAMTDRCPRRRADASDVARRAPAHDPGAAAPAGRRPRITHRGGRPAGRGPRGPDDPRGLPRQRHRDPDALLRAQAARLRRLPDVRRRGRGRGAPADLAAPGPPRPGMVVQTQTDAAPPAAQDEPGADLQRPQRLLPAALPEQVPQPHRHPGLPQGERRGQLRASRPASSSAPSRSQRSWAGSAPRRARSTAGATRSTRRSPSATATATPATRSCKAQAGGHRAAAAVRGPAARPASGWRSSAPARPAWPRPTTCSSPATT